MPFLISSAILHTISNQEDGSHYSEQELDIDSEICSEFVSKHVRRLLRNPAAREAVFSENSQVYALVQAFQKGELAFRAMSLQIARRLSEIVQGNEDIPSSDVLVAFFDNAGKTYLALIKLNFGECFTHKYTQTENGLDNQIVKNTDVLPLGAGKVEEACLIPYDPMVLRILEKPHTVGGEAVNYFSKLFLECETELSKKETADLILDIAEEINTKHFGGNIEVDAKVKCALMDEADGLSGEDGVILDNVVRRVFEGEGDEAVRAEFIDLAKEHGLPHEVKLDKPFVQKKFKMQEFRADNGIEIRCPAELFRDPESVVVTTHSDGAVSITLKNLRRHESD